MATAIHNSYSAVVPAVYGTATPVIDVGRGASSINAVVALTDAGSVVVNLGSAPPGAVTYTASGLAHEMSLGSSAPSSAPVMPAKSSTALADHADNGAQVMLGQESSAGQGLTPPLMARAYGVDGIAGVYDDRGIFLPTGAGLRDDGLPNAGSVPASGSSGGVIRTQA